MIATIAELLGSPATATAQAKDMQQDPAATIEATTEGCCQSAAPAAASTGPAIQR